MGKLSKFSHRGKNGAVAQLGERYVRNVQVGGSIPLCSIGIIWRRAKRGVSGALNPEPAIPGLNSHTEASKPQAGVTEGDERTGPTQRTAVEPRQGRKAAAVGGIAV